MISWKTSIYFAAFLSVVPNRGELTGENPVISINKLFSGKLTV
jgi:hypothetical protein